MTFILSILAISAIVLMLYAAVALVQPKPERFRGQHLLGWLRQSADAGRSSRYCHPYAYKAFDMICFDWYFMAKVHFFQYYYPETADCASYRQFGFNRRSQTVRIIVYLICALIAWMCTFI